MFHQPTNFFIQARHSLHCLSCIITRQMSSTARPAMNVFDRSAKRLQRNRTAHLHDSQIYDYIRKEVAYQVYDRINDIKRKFDVLVDLGCHRGHVSKLITKETCQVIYQCDMAQDILDESDTSPEVTTHKLLCDEEFIPFAKDSVDICVSNLSLHWVNDLPSTLAQINACLKPDGVFIASMFGGDTLYELRVALQLAELEREGGFGPHISPFIEGRDIGDLLSAAGFTLLTVDVDMIRVGYPSMLELLYDLQGMGESCCSWDRKPGLHRESLLAAAAIYKEMYGSSGEGDREGIPASYQIYFMIGWKPHPTQQKPAPRGSAQVSMKDLDKIDDMINDDKQ